MVNKYGKAIWIKSSYSDKSLKPFEYVFKNELKVKKTSSGKHRLFHIININIKLSRAKLELDSIKDGTALYKDYLNGAHQIE